MATGQLLVETGSFLVPTGQLLVETGSFLVATGLRAGRFAPLLAKARRWIDSSARLY